ncbi:MAG: IMPACT family protein [Planctomycetota bacterium]|nr:IMPACT family protein [Planctomycetota bacterium]MDG2142494.1 IMPACT family protein [Planctomycetota bacterium]
MAITRYRTIAERFRYEPDKIKGSRFIADLAPVVTVAEAEGLLAEVRTEFPDAGHHCYAWIIDPEGKQTRSSDDGEPGSSAGPPILRMIEGHGLTGLVVVVSRWFGGTKLGVGGLMRAYGGCAGEAMDRCKVIEVRVQVAMTIEYPYECSGPVEGLLRSCEVETKQADYTDNVVIQVTLPKDREVEFHTELVERTSGRALITEPDRLT